MSAPNNIPIDNMPLFIWVFINRESKREAIVGLEMKIYMIAEIAGEKVRVTSHSILRLTGAQLIEMLFVIYN